MNLTNEHTDGVAIVRVGETNPSPRPQDSIATVQEQTPNTLSGAER